MGSLCKKIVDQDIHDGPKSGLKKQNSKLAKFVYEISQTKLYSNNPQEVTQMSREVHYQTHLKRQGIHEDFILHPEYFQICLLCSSYYGPSLKTIVLQCGHFICQNCLLRTANCVVHTCGAPINIDKNRTFVFNKKNVQPQIKKLKYYDLIVNVSQNTHTQIVEIKVQGSQKFSEILQKNQKMRQIFAGGSPNFVIKSYSKTYNDIKDKTLDELANELKLQSTQSGKRITLNTMQQKKGINDLCVRARILFLIILDQFAQLITFQGENNELLIS